LQGQNRNDHLSLHAQEISSSRSLPRQFLRRLSTAKAMTPADTKVLNPASRQTASHQRARKTEEHEIMSGDTVGARRFCCALQSRVPNLGRSNPTTESSGTRLRFV